MPGGGYVVGPERTVCCGRCCNAADLKFAGGQHFDEVGGREPDRHRDRRARQQLKTLVLSGAVPQRVPHHGMVTPPASASYPTATSNALGQLRQLFGPFA